MRLKVQEVDAALREALGNKAAVGRRFGVTRQAVEAMIKRTPSLQATLHDIEEGMLDNAESSLYREVIDGNFQAVKWYLATKGKARGYVERQEVSGSLTVATFTADDAAAAEARETAATWAQMTGKPRAAWEK